MRRQSLRVCNCSWLDNSDVWLARKYRTLHDDFEDNFILAAAERAKVDFLVTSDQSLLRKATVAALSPQDMLAVLKASTK
jgi:predicted nucleic acid-binding protein